MTTAPRKAFAFGHNGRRQVIEPRSDEAGDYWVVVAREVGDVRLGDTKTGAKRRLIAMLDERSA
ncbi:hypothetical protein RKE25_22160 (plasmid) [Dyella sp. BiH032]|uniref:hypothetical protein n=1 Tax=Dyella sp. BiH032 TaxID=3075430 RepID=UPI002892F639|nr:hypothetical protein [Dyella sp. BiH032]WNL48436.1 hypothetical protein RKE25_22160 [Dyella sp. BiH032]